MPSGVPIMERAEAGIVEPGISSHLAQLLAIGDMAAARRLVMDLYREPLIAYVDHVPWSRRLRTLPGCETAESIVDGFMASRVGDDRVLRAWCIDRCRFRAWIRRTMQNHLLALSAAARRQQANLARYAERGLGNESDDEGAAGAMDAAMRTTLVRRAIADAGQRAFELGRANEWRAFLLHELHDEPLSSLEHLLPGTVGAKCAAMRRMRQYLVESLRSLVAWPGATDAAIDEELEALMGAPRRSAE